MDCGSAKLLAGLRRAWFSSRPLHELHHDVRDVLVFAEVVHRHHVRVRQPRRGLGLAFEARRVVGGRGLVGQVAAQHGLDGHGAVQPRVHRLVDHAHGTLPQHLHQPVAAQVLQRG
jgi:hypothetical protein